MFDKLSLGLIVTLILCTRYAFAEPDPNFYVYLCFGQSNMESGGKMEAMDRTVDKRFQVMADADSNSRAWKNAADSGSGWPQAITDQRPSGQTVACRRPRSRRNARNWPRDRIGGA